MSIIKLTVRYDILIFFFSLFIFTSCFEQKRNIDIPNEQLKAGDLVFRKGISVKSHAVMYADPEGIYSHVGIVVETDSFPMIVHVTPGERMKNDTVDIIKMEKIEDFFSPQKAKSGAIMRFMDSVDYCSDAAKHAVRLYRKDILFDFDYNLEDSTSMYCTELVWRAYLYSGRDITKGKRNTLNNFPGYSGTYIFPSDIYTNNSLTTIYKF